MSEIALQFNNPVIVNNPMTSTVVSQLIDLSNVLGWAVDAQWSGSPVGNIVISGGNNPNSLQQISSTAASGASGKLLSNNDGIHYNYLQVSYVFTSGAGILNVSVSGKNYV
jgi:hypothetical protein